MTAQPPISATHPDFLGTLERWLSGLPEMLVMIRYSAAAGNRDFELFSSFEVLSNRISQLPPSTSIIAFRQPQLPMRGVVDEVFIARCLSYVPDGAEFLVVETVPRSVGGKSTFHYDEGETHAELRETLEDLRNASVAVGLYPPFIRDTDNVVAAIVPDNNGLVSTGVY
jgi:hypothetical protein